jgi:hypothetical protein
MTKRSAWHTVFSCTAIALAGAIVACSSSSSPTSNNPGQKSPGSAQKGDSLNLSGTYALASFTTDSADGGSSSVPVDANNGGTLVLTSTNYNLTWTGTFAQNGGGGNSGTYTAVDTSSTVDRGTLTLTSSNGTQAAMYQFSTDTFTVTIPRANGSDTQVTVWIKQ